MMKRTISLPRFLLCLPLFAALLMSACSNNEQPVDPGVVPPEPTVGGLVIERNGVVVTESEALTFEDTLVGKYSPVLMLTLKNKSKDVLKITQMPFMTGEGVDDFFLSGSLITQIPTDGVFEIKLKFNPSSEGARTVTLSLTTQDSAGKSTPLNFTLKANGTLPPKTPIMKLSDESNTYTTSISVELGSKTVGSSIKVKKIITIANKGEGVLNLLGTPYPLVLGGTHSADFKIVQPNQSSVAPQSTVDFTVEFDPQASGRREAQVLIKTNDPSEPDFILKVKGTGT